MGSFSDPLAENDSDLTLARRCVTGEDDAERELFHAHRRRVHATLFRILGSNAAMDDLIQDAFLNVFRSLKTYRGEAALATWIDRCVVRVAYLHIARRKLRTAPLELVRDVSSDSPSAERRVLAREAARRLYDYLGKMDPKLRLALTLHALDGRPLAEVAKLMSSSVVATKARVWRARRLLVQHARRDPALAAFLLGDPATGARVA